MKWFSTFLAWNPAYKFSLLFFADRPSIAQTLRQSLIVNCNRKLFDGQNFLGIIVIRFLDLMVCKAANGLKKALGRFWLNALCPFYDLGPITTKTACPFRPKCPRRLALGIDRNRFAMAGSFTVSTAFLPHTPDLRMLNNDSQK